MTTRSSARLILPAIGLAVILTGCSAATGEATPTTSAPAAQPSTTDAGQPGDVMTGLVLPWSIVFVGTTALVNERDTGRILEVNASGESREVGVVPGVVPGGEAGLLGLAVDEQDRLYAYSTGEDGNRIQWIELTGDPGAYALGDVTTIFDGIPSSRYHNGGRIAFGPDGMLYAGVGDAGDRELAQEVDSLSGKILRITPDGEVPADNPFAGSPVYSYGHRNVQGLAWGADGTMFASEFGQDTWDELNVIEAGGNYGWPVVEGVGDGSENFIDPVQQWTPAEASPSGIAVLDDTLYIANLRGETLRAVPVADPTERTDHLVGEYGRLRTVAVAPDGNLWLLTNNTNGRVEPRPGDDRIVSIAPPV